MDQPATSSATGQKVNALKLLGNEDTLERIAGLPRVGPSRTWTHDHPPFESAFLQPGDLARCARVCRAMLEPSLDLLWAYTLCEVPTHLWALLAPERLTVPRPVAWAINDPRSCAQAEELIGEIEKAGLWGDNEHWARFEQYAARIRVLIYGKSGDLQKIQDSLFRRIAADRKTVIFCNLKHLEWNAESLLPDNAVFTLASLDSLHVSLETTHTTSVYPTAGPGGWIALQSMLVGDGRPSLALADRTVSMLSMLGESTEVTLTISCSTHTPLAELVIFPPEASFQPLRSLRNLVVTSQVYGSAIDVQMFHLFLDGIAGLPLRQVSLDFLPSSCSPVDNRLRAPVSISQILQPLLSSAASWPTLEELSVTSTVGSRLLCIDDADMEKIATAGLKLRTLRLICDLAPLPALLTLYSLVRVARGLPEMEVLRLPAFIPYITDDLRKFEAASALATTPQSKLRRLHIGHSDQRKDMSLEVTPPVYYPDPLLYTALPLNMFTAPVYHMHPPLHRALPWVAHNYQNYQMDFTDFHAQGARILHDIFPALDVSCEQAQQAMAAGGPFYASDAWAVWSWGQILWRYHLQGSDESCLCAEGIIVQSQLTSAEHKAEHGW
ncbi:hypothetical protein OH77DRAFT_1514102 [Trametes cingulata]|nr:hypothetical protein OH77DRAFT_1514102 [Trametes cingulata]